MAGTFCLRDLLELALRERAGALRLSAGERPVLLTNSSEKLAIDVVPLTTQDISGLLASIASAEQMSELNRCGDASFLYELPHARFSVRATRQGECLDVVIKNLSR